MGRNVSKDKSSDHAYVQNLEVEGGNSNTETGSLCRNIYLIRLASVCLLVK